MTKLKKETKFLLIVVGVIILLVASVFINNAMKKFGDAKIGDDEPIITQSFHEATQEACKNGTFTQQDTLEAIDFRNIENHTLPHTINIDSTSSIFEIDIDISLYPSGRFMRFNECAEEFFNIGNSEKMTLCLRENGGGCFYARENFYLVELSSNSKLLHQSTDEALSFSQFTVDKSQVDAVIYYPENVIERDFEKMLFEQFNTLGNIYKIDTNIIEYREDLKFQYFREYVKNNANEDWTGRIELVILKKLDIEEFRTTDNKITIKIR
jgi:hypothetical protein|tara:strand:+ start:1557 stop:2360 length:804 start_codon:yes stop_codon:yes gene_type:complete